MCINPAWYPYESYSDGEHQGMISDYLRLIMKNVGIRYRLIPSTTWRETLLMAKSGKCDLIAGAMQTVQRSSYLEFSKPYLSIPAVVATKPQNSAMQLNDKRIGVIARSAFHDILSNRYPEADFIIVDNYLDALRMLKSGQIDAVAGADASLTYLLKEQQISDITISDVLHDSWDISVAVTKNQPYLLGIMNKSIERITPKEHEQINNRWMTVEYKHTVDYRIIWWLLMAVGVVSVFALYRYLRMSAYNKMLKRIAEKDALTGILSRHKLRSELEGFIDLADRHDWRLSLIFFDIDDFKLVNDQYGHAVGDRVLIELSRLVVDGSRKTDRFGRWGGEEFLFLMLETDLTSAHQIAEKIRQKISEHNFSISHLVTCSFGVAEYEKGESIEQLVNRADRALYISKQTGKNKVEDSLP
ncbi:diguanylate cyclase [Neptuniibacter sp.]|uniref:diguanylate cyclase n=1 Tax=Neptuniibacter sp. TaxID=1962643 RepID=UPI0026134113|nr:diguanylate cyclase [Neptuniibacter sp.]MCP4598824.1 diguanylate cyclase [Neptuniibacter sp.]